MILQQIRHRERRDMIGLAADLMRKESMALLNLNPARQQRLEHRLDFLLSQLQMHLATVDCKVSLRFTFPDDHFDFAALKSLPGASGDG